MATYVTSTLVAKDALATFMLNNTFIANANRRYEGMFTQTAYDQGNSINIRKENQFSVSTGNTVTAQEVSETYETLTLESIASVPIKYTTDDLTTKLKYDSWRERVLNPAVKNLSAYVNKQIAAKAATSLYIHTGTAGTSVNTFASVDLAGAIMTELGVDPGQNWAMALGPRDASALKSALYNSFNTTLNSEISLKSRLGNLSYFDVFVDQSIATQQSYAGSLGTPVLASAASSGSTLSLSGCTVSITGLFKEGDVITIEDSSAQPYFVNKVNKVSTGQQAQFVVTADADSDASGLVTLSVSPEIVISGNNQNFSAEMPSGATVTRAANSTDYSHKVNVCYPNTGLYFVAPPLAKLDSPDSSVIVDPQTGLSLRLSKSAEVLDNLNVMRLDILWGALWDPEQCIRLVS